MNIFAVTSWIWLAISMLTASSMVAQTESVKIDAKFQVRQGTQLGSITIRAELEPGFHIYSQRHPGPEIATKIRVNETGAFRQLGKFTSDRPAQSKSSGSTSAEFFEEQVIWSAPIEFSDDVDPQKLNLNIKFLAQVCKGSQCRPFQKELRAPFAGFDANVVVPDLDRDFQQAEETDSSVVDSDDRVSPDTPKELERLASLYNPKEKIHYQKLDGSSGVGTFLGALIGAFLGGILLNLMPCVFPVLGLKVMGFVLQSGSDGKRIRYHGLAFALGLLVSMWTLAGAILTVKTVTGDAIAWGQQMANPYFVGAIVIMLFLLGLNMVGMFELGLFMTRVDRGQHHGYAGSFATGVITTLVATPCSGPFLGTAMGYTLSQTAGVALLLFTVFGLGISTPYLVLSFFPKLISRLPKPGPWMETFKKLMGFTMFAAATVFVTTFGRQTGVDGISWFLMALCVLSLAMFFYGKFSLPDIDSKRRYLVGWALPIPIAAFGIWMFLVAANHEAPIIASENSRWQRWVPGRVEDALANNQLVWVDYTADW